MAEITLEELNGLISDLVNAESPSCERLVAVVERTIRPTVKKWAGSSRLLDGEADDLMQEIQIKIMKNVVTKFLMRDGVLNTDPHGFKNWIFKVAENTKNDYCRMLNRYSGSSAGANLSIDDEENPIIAPDPSSQSEFEIIEHRQQLAEAFDTVIKSKAAIYKVLTWLAQSLILIRKRTTRIMSKNELINTCSDMTLSQMYAVIVSAGESVSFLKITPEQNVIITEALLKNYNGKSIGEYCYKEFFMKKGSDASVSDWVNKLDSKVRLKEKSQQRGDNYASFDDRGNT